jgi:predicted RND superfamily exporter protein
LTLSSVPGLQRGGALISVGVFACLAATLWVLPAVEAVWGRRDQRGVGMGTGSETSARPPLRR